MMSVTSAIYGAIRDGDYTSAIDLLQERLSEHLRTRPLLSLLAYCCFHNEEYARASELYEELTVLCPEVEEYKVSYVQALVKCGSHADAARVAASTEVASPSNAQRLTLLQAHAELEQGMLPACTATLSSPKLEEECPERIMALATLEYRQGRFAKALELYSIAKRVVGDEPILAYNVALCCHQQGNHDTALTLVNEIIDEAREEEKDDGINNVDSVLTEALNLKAASLAASTKAEAAKEAIKELCESQNGQLDDFVTIHNDAIVNIEEDPAVGLQKLEYLLANQPPPEALGNLLTLYTTHGQDSLATETFETNKQLAKELLPPDVYAYFDALSMSISSPEDALRLLEKQSAQHTPKLRSGKKDVSEAIQSASARPATSHRSASARPTTAAERMDQRAIETATKDFEGTLDSFIPTLMLQARLLWDKKDYSEAELLLQKSKDFCANHDAWRMNMGHILFAQQKFQHCIEHYQQLVKSCAEADLLKVPPVALANLCVSYVMTNQNEVAEALIKAVEREENQQSALGNGERTYHSCIINLSIGTLYCERGQYDFGISRVTKSLEPFEENLTQDTWTYAKLCFLSLASKVSKMMCTLSEDTLQDILGFLEDVERNCRHIVAGSEDTGSSPKEPPTIAREASELKDVYIKICA